LDETLRLFQETRDEERVESVRIAQLAKTTSRVFSDSAGSGDAIRQAGGPSLRLLNDADRLQKAALDDVAGADKEFGEPDCSDPGLDARLYALHRAGGSMN
jgi:hypothetical protein